jgi:hypothetical protein
MYSNFIFNGVSSEMLSIICVKFGSTTGADTVSGGGETELNIQKTPHSSKFYITGQEYSNPLSFKFQIINKDGSNIDENKERSIKKILCKRGEYCKLEIDDERYNNVWFLANISNPQLLIVSDVVGMEFTVTCDAPFGYSNLSRKNYKITTNSQQLKLNINNDEDSCIYPDLVITVLEDCNLSISNSTEPLHRVFTINNVKANEVITVKGSVPDIRTSLVSHNIWKDFNKRWLRFSDGLNTLTVSNKCNITLSYTEPRKVGISV